MRPILGRFSEIVYALMRCVVGLLFACHGAQKLLGWFGKEPAGEALMQLAGGIELIGGLMIALGLFASPAAFLASGTMAVAYFMAHAPQGNVIAPMLNGASSPRSTASSSCFSPSPVRAR